MYYAAFAVKRTGIRNGIQTGLLIAASLIFYSWVSISYIFWLIGFVLINYLFGLVIGKSKNKARRFVTAVAVVINVGTLAFFKYFGALIDSVPAMSGAWKLLETAGIAADNELVAPLAVSFLTFKAIAYIVDVCKEKTPCEKNFPKFFLFMTFFGALTQGPIIRFADFGTQLTVRTHSVDKFSAGIKRFIYGLGKKVMIANTLAMAYNRILESSHIGTVEAWLAAVMFALQLYYDFSGYSDMAIGIGKMFGFDLPENFDYPFTACSVQEFWRRWHMSLSFWLRDYVYIPLGGNRKGKVRTLINIFAVFVITGIWHGSTVNFLVWGVYYAIFSIIERLFLGKLLEKNPVKTVNRLYTFLVFVIGLVIFRIPDLKSAFDYIGLMFSGVGFAVNHSLLSAVNIDAFLALIFGILFSGIVQRPLGGFYEKHRDSVAFNTADFILQIVIFAISIVMIISGSYAPSIYAAF